MTRLKYIVIAVLLLGCGKSEDKKDPGPVPVPQAPPPIPAPAQPPQPPETPSVTRILVSFEKDDVVDECIEVTITSPQLDNEKLDKAADALLGGLKDKDKEVVPIKKPCAEQFHDRTPLGTCRFTKATKVDGKEKEIDVDTAWITRSYNVNTVDTYMKDCMELGGDWMAADKQAADREKLRQHSKQLIKEAEKLP